MPKLMDETMETINTSSNYGFSAVKMDALGATEYTLATIVVDKSSSLSGYDRDLEKMVKESVKSCQKSSRSENLMVRVLAFNQDEDEIHGFKLLENIDEDDYTNQINTGGTTALYDTIYHAVEATGDYGKILVDQDYMANAIVFVITDGMDVGSTLSAKSVATMIDKVRKSETLESLEVILIGMSRESGVQQYLDDLKRSADMNEFIDMGDVTTAKLARLANFVSQSISSSSQALVNGVTVPSQSLSF